MSTQLILHIPHASDRIPDRTGYVATDEKINEEIQLLTDWYTDDLFNGANSIVVKADFNRVFCDVERFADDDNEIMSKSGMGVTYTKCDDGSDLRHVTPSLKTDIFKNYYYPHHQRLEDVVAQQLSLNGKALIIDCHSFSDEPFLRDLSQDIPRPDICIGIDGYHSPRTLYEPILAKCTAAGYLTKINSPYSGSIVPMKYYRKNPQVCSLMVEINRRLYLHQSSNQKNDNYKSIQQLCSSILNLAISFSF